MSDSIRVTASLRIAGDFSFLRPLAERSPAAERAVLEATCLTPALPAVMASAERALASAA